MKRKLSLFLAVLLTFILIFPISTGLVYADDPPSVVTGDYVSEWVPNKGFFKAYLYGETVDIPDRTRAKCYFEYGFSIGELTFTTRSRTVRGETEFNTYIYVCTGKTFYYRSAALVEGTTYYGDTETLSVSTDENATGRCANFVISSNSAPEYIKDQADFICDGTDDYEEWESAYNNLAAIGGGSLTGFGPTFTWGAGTLTIDQNMPTIIDFGGAEINCNTTIPIDINTGVAATKLITLRNLHLTRTSNTIDGLRVRNSSFVKLEDVIISSFRYCIIIDDETFQCEGIGFENVQILAPVSAGVLIGGTRVAWGSSYQRLNTKQLTVYLNQVGSVGVEVKQYANVTESDLQIKVWNSANDTKALLVDGRLGGTVDVKAEDTTGARTGTIGLEFGANYDSSLSSAHYLTHFANLDIPYSWIGEGFAEIDSSTPYSYSEGDLKTRSVENILPNGSFETTGATPSGGWITVGGGASFVRSSAQAKIGTYSYAITRAGANASIRYVVPNYARYLGKDITLTVWCYSSLANATRARITTDGFSTYTNSVAHSGDSSWELLEARIYVPSTATGLGVSLEVILDTTVYWDGAIMIQGNHPVEFMDKLSEAIISHHTSDYILSAYENGFVIHTNLNAGGTITLTLPQSVSAGFTCRFAVMNANELRIDPGAAGAIWINGAKQADDHYITADDEAESVILTADGNGDWIASSVVGTWGVE